MKNVLFVGGLAAFAIAAPAAAQVAPEVDNAFTGPRVEAKVGYEFVNSGVRGSQDFAGRGTFGAGSSGESLTGGVEAGFDHQAGKLTLGAYAGYDLSRTKVSSPARPYNLKTGRNLTAGVRAGIVFYPGVIGYVKGGYSNGRNSVSYLTGANPTLFNSYKKNRGGYHVGAGFEFPVENRLYAKVEYVYSQYKKYQVDANNTLPFSRHQILTGIGIRF